MSRRGGEADDSVETKGRQGGNGKTRVRAVGCQVAIDGGINASVSRVGWELCEFPKC